MNKSDWIKTADRLPLHKEQVLVQGWGWAYIVFYDEEKDLWYWQDGDLWGEAPLHWMPLPGPPNTGMKGECDGR